MDTKNRPTILIVDDDPAERSALAEAVSAAGYEVETATNGEEALDKLDPGTIAAVITDLMMPRLDGFELLRRMRDFSPAPPTIVLTAFGSITQAVSIVHELRAFWFLEKPADPTILSALLGRAVELGSLVRETKNLQRQLSNQGVLGDLVGTSKPMQQVATLIRRVAPTRASVLITGESGTGKEMVARTIHRLSPRADAPFVAINCAALPEDLIESELFGHEKGAFTGAIGRRAGCFEQAHGGTLFLDEIGEMPMAMQARLLRTLEESKVRRLGATGEIQVDVRVLAATQRSVGTPGASALREDLYYRLNVFNIDLPPLRDRKDDILLLALSILNDLNRKHDTHVVNLHPETLDRLLEHAWPGNVRELRNVLEWSVITAGMDTIHPRHLPKTFNAPPVSFETQTAPKFAPGKRLQEIEMDYIRYTLETTNNDRKKAARILGISIRTLYNRLAEVSASEPKQKGQASGQEVA